MVDDYMYRVRVASQGWGGAPGLNQYYFAREFPEPVDDATKATNVFARVHSVWSDIQAVFPASWSANVIPEVDVLNADNGDLVASHAQTALAPLVGTATQTFAPQVVMLCGAYTTSGIIDGRRVRGRTFIGPPANAADADGTPLNGQVAALQGWLAALLGGTINNPAQVVWSRRKPVSLQHPTGLGGSAHVIENVTIRDTYAILTSRRQ